ncbi:MAG: tetratricopeptide repeat protein [Deltaproteobacteria bacterium]|nr:tetratricopeptide repeat protein [Deltaproteobacteria bacterium]
MPEKKISRKELLKSPDEFLTFSEKAIRFFQQNSEKIFRSAALVLALVLLMAGLKWYLGYRDRQILTDYAEAMVKTSHQKKFDAAKQQEAAASLEKFIKDYPRSASARSALLNLGDIYYNLNKFDLSEQAYQKFLDGLKPEEESFKPLVLDSQGYVLEAQNKFDQAAERWKQLLGLPGDSLKQEALISLGRVYLTAGRKDDARKAYQELISTYPSSGYLELAKAQLSQIK